MLLREALQRRSQRLYNRFTVLESNARALLEYSQAGAHMTFTPHGLSHVTSVEKNYDWLLCDTDIDLFNCEEIFILLSATYFHDAMMIPKYMGNENEARQKHAQLATEFLRKNHEKLGLQLNESVVIGQVIKGHSVNTMSELENEMVIGNDIVNIHKLAACLSMSDICHADESRAPWIVKAHLELDDESEYHWSRHLQISGITRNGNNLVMSAITFSKDGENAVNEYKKMIENQLIICQPYFNTVLSPLREVKLSISSLASPLEQSYKFNANMPEILSLLIEGVYSQKSVFIRELVQNSLDACMVRQARSRKANIIYNPQIVLTLYNNGKQVQALRVDDNGVGMSIKDIKDTFLWIGSSIRQNENIVSLIEETMGKHLIATFGIGILSCFSVASHIYITSCKENETPIEFCIKGISDTITPKESNDSVQGSTFYIEFDNRKYDETIDKIRDTLSYYFKDIHQADLCYMELPIDDNSLTRTRDMIFSMARSEAKKVQPEGFDSNNIIYSKQIIGENYSGLFWINGSGEESISRSGTLEILNEGIFVVKDSIKNWLPRYLSVFNGRINLSAKTLDLVASRDAIRENEKATAFRDELRHKSLALFSGLVKKQSQERSSNEMLSILIMDMYRQIDTDSINEVLRKLDPYCVKLSGTDKFIALKDIVDTVYVEYPAGRFVEELTVFERKKLYHKSSEFVQLQTSLMLQSGKQVLTAVYNDSKSHAIANSLCEINLIKAYCKRKGIEVVNLVEQNIIEGMYRSKKIDSYSRELLGPNVKFVEISGLPNKKTWVVGSDIWVNISNPFMRAVYNVLNNPQSGLQQKKVAKAIIENLCYKFDDATTTLYEVMCSDNTSET